MHQLMHTNLLWEPCYQNLISVGSDNHLYQWQVLDYLSGHNDEGRPVIQYKVPFFALIAVSSPLLCGMGTTVYSRSTMNGVGT